MKTLFNQEITDELFDHLMCEQAKGKEIKIVDGKIVAVEKVLTQEELEAKKQEEYENSIVSLIRKKYTLNQELAILRQRDSKPTEFAEYNAYVEQCKQEVKNNLTINL